MRGGSQTDASEPRTSLECACSRSITRQQADQQINRALGRSTRDESTIKQQQESTCSQHSENPPQPFSLSCCLVSFSLSSPLSLAATYGSQHRHHCDTSRRIVLLDRELLRVSLALASRACKLRDHFVAWSRTCLRRPIARCSFIWL